MKRSHSCEHNAEASMLLSLLLAVTQRMTQTISILNTAVFCDLPIDISCDRVKLDVSTDRHSLYKLPIQLK